MAYDEYSPNIWREADVLFLEDWDVKKEPYSNHVFV